MVKEAVDVDYQLFAGPCDDDVNLWIVLLPLNYTNVVTPEQNCNGSCFTLATFKPTSCTHDLSVRTSHSSPDLSNNAF